MFKLFGTPYLTKLPQPYSPTRALRSVDQHILAVPKSRPVSRGDRAFSVVAPKVWNSLLLNVQSTQFETRLKHTYFLWYFISLNYFYLRVFTLVCIYGMILLISIQCILHLHFVQHFGQLTLFKKTLT